MRIPIAGLICLLLLTAEPACGGPTELNDEELDQVVARGLNLNLDAATGNFSFLSQGHNNLATGDGTIKIGPIVSSNRSNTVSLSGNAQQNLRALLNLIAVDSLVQVLVNLTVNINSSTGPIFQTNGIHPNF